ncbi:hypothetical protein UFOVP448_24 [uncultured Caudovirales phage]|uniref:Uncharacterized protein n=1 Tax=uncultured Caudovirales phage TaxID=2100421 RepID=A0A6J5MBZ2_9CAUD|nr:hypothetical protein UFOVP448_24 [uncultured Caudovirales phage]
MNYLQKIPPSFTPDSTTDMQNGTSYTTARVVVQSCTPSADRESIFNQLTINNCSTDFRTPIYYILTLSPRTIDTLLNGPYVPSAARDSYQSFLRQKHLLINTVSFVNRQYGSLIGNNPGDLPMCHFEWCSIVPDADLPLVHSTSNHFYSSFILAQPNPIPLAYTYFIGYRSRLESPTQTPFMSLLRTYYTFPDSPFKDPIDDALDRNVDLRHWFDSDFLPIFLANYDPPTNPTTLPEYSYYFDHPYHRASNAPIKPYIAMPQLGFSTSYNLRFYPHDSIKNKAMYSIRTNEFLYGLKFRHEFFPEGDYRIPIVDLFRPIPLAYDDDPNAALLVPVQ